MAASSQKSSFSLARRIFPSWSQDPRCSVALSHSDRTMVTDPISSLLAPQLRKCRDLSPACRLYARVSSGFDFHRPRLGCISASLLLTVPAWPQKSQEPPSMVQGQQSSRPQ